ncbi:YbhB/YbcL family Raf kinase inhibitor-like protein [Sphaerisporangium corydalis]|uniref:YbhB/YbcL family Raf kinase inhibitor-like protein n=1 Tax=Sphaerisporangium corydalis TaxID=1441875 RepID=A0ABV9EWK8_9ACTN|nr:YbhB/YbcL family Raf kinase inhibitor-like protein [Sphaerisporangium corydalis]
MKIGGRGVIACGFALAVALTGCSGDSSAPDSEIDSPPADLKVSSTAFAEGAAIPRKHVCAGQGGQNVSPPLTWRGIPEAARELAIVVDDPDAPGGSYLHWIVTGVSTTDTGVAEGDSSGKAAPGSSGEAAYAGPCPPSGVHHYHFIVYALREPLKPNGDAKAIREQIESLAITSGETIGTWKAQS